MSGSIELTKQDDLKNYEALLSQSIDKALEKKIENGSHTKKVSLVSVLIIKNRVVTQYVIDTSALSIEW